jgi:predicted RNA binding protein YcfA (HicA-like mRNA interferase family)
VSRGTYSGEDVIKALQKWRFKQVDQTGSHVKLRYIHPEGEKRTVIVPLHDELDTGTLKSIADQAGANEFQAFLDELEKLV